MAVEQNPVKLVPHRRFFRFARGCPAIGYVFSQHYRSMPWRDRAPIEEEQTLPQSDSNVARFLLPRRKIRQQSILQSAFPLFTDKNTLPNVRFYSAFPLLNTMKLMVKIG
jgi:hypothetical protein